ncbi:MAG TPA: AsmA family protein [Methylophilaceae bacterium]
MTDKIKTHKTLFAFTTTILALLVVIAVCELLGWPFLEKPLEHFAANGLQRSIRIDGPFKLRLIGGIRLQAGGIWISAPAGFDVPDLVDAKNVELKLHYRDLWKIKPGDPYLIESIKAQQLDANLARHLDGKSTWQFNKKPDDPIRPFPTIHTLVISQGQAKVDDQLTKAALLFTFSTDEGSSNTQSLSKVEVHGDFRERPLKSELITHGFLPIATQDAKSAPIASSGWLRYGKVDMRFNGSVDDLFGKQIVKGNLTVTGPSLGDLGDLLSITLPRTSAFKLSGSVEKTPGLWQVVVSSAHIGESDLFGNFAYDTRPEKSFLRGTLQGKRLMLADLGPAFGSAADAGKANASGADTKAQQTGRMFPDKPLNFATYNRMNAELDIDIDYLDLGKAFRQPITPFKANLYLNKNKLSLAKIYATTAQGSITGNISIDAHEQQKVANPQLQKNDSQLKPDWQIDLAMQNINLEKWLQVPASRKKAKQEHKLIGSEAYVTGLLNSKAHLQGKGNTTAELLRSLNGDLFVYIRNGEISHLVIEAAGLDIAQAAGLLIKGDEDLKLQCAVGKFESHQGIVKPDLAVIDTNVTTLLFDGDVNLGEEKLNLRMTAKPKNFSPFTVRAPIEITGTFLDPHVKPKTGPIAARVAGGALLVLVNPLAAILPFMDPGSNSSKDGNPCSQTFASLRSNANGAAAK